MTDDADPRRPAPDGAADGTPPAGPGDASAIDLDEARRLDRRRFFRSFAGDAVNVAATLAGVAGALRQTSAEAAGTLLAASGLGGGVGAAAYPPGPAGSGGPAQPGAGLLAAPGAGPGAVPSPTFRSPFRLDGERLVLLDQRRLPDELVEVECLSGADVAQAMRDGVVVGAPALGQVVALGLALSAGRAASSRPWSRRAIIAGTGNALRNARPGVANVGWAVDRMLARFAAFGELDPDGEGIARSLRQEAEAIVAEATLDHARLVRLGGELLPSFADRPTRVLTLGSTGPLSAGQVGTALSVVQVAAADGRAMHVHVAETRPGLEGARLAAWELGQAGIAFDLVVDAAAGWLLAGGEVDAVLVGADWIAANGDVAAVPGTYPLAAIAARHGVPVHVVAPVSSVDPAAADGAAIPRELRAASEVVFVRGVRSAPAGAAAVNPASDITPAELVTTIVTEEGVLRPPFGPALSAAVGAARARRPRPAPRAGEAEPAAAAARIEPAPVDRSPDVPGPGPGGD